MKYIRLVVPPIFVILYAKARSFFVKQKLFDGDSHLFRSAIKGIHLYGEYGCGTSTLWMLENTACNVIAVDTSLEWVKHVREKAVRQNERLNIQHVDLGELGEWGRPIGYRFKSRFQHYTDHMWLQEKTPEVVLVDGRFRVCCFLTSLKFAKPGTKIIFDDYADRVHYHFVEKYIAPLSIKGRQALFIVPDKSSLNLKELEIDIREFRCVFD